MDTTEGAVDTVRFADVPISRRRKLVGYGLMALFPVAVIVAVFVLAAMASAAATGGCGGG
jgi:hypothetical protein